MRGQTHLGDQILLKCSQSPGRNFDVQGRGDVLERCTLAHNIVGGQRYQRCAVGAQDLTVRTADIGNFDYRAIGVECDSIDQFKLTSRAYILSRAFRRL